MVVAVLCWGVYGRVQHGDGVEVMAAGVRRQMRAYLLYIHV